MSEQRSFANEGIEAVLKRETDALIAEGGPCDRLIKAQHRLSESVIEAMREESPASAEPYRCAPRQGLSVDEGVKLVHGNYGLVGEFGNGLGAYLNSLQQGNNPFHWTYYDRWRVILKQADSPSQLSDQGGELAEKLHLNGETQSEALWRIADGVVAFLRESDMVWPDEERAIMKSLRDYVNAYMEVENCMDRIREVVSKQEDLHAVRCGVGSRQPKVLVPEGARAWTPEERIGHAQTHGNPGAVARGFSL